jgi:hypothetical protein
MTDNPYAPPTAIEPQNAHAIDHSIYRVGKWLALRDGAELPHACTATNEPTGPENWRKQRKIAWTPPWVIALVLINFLIMLIVALCVQKTGKITYSLSQKARKKWLRMILTGWLLILLCPVSIWLGIEYFSSTDYVWLPILVGACCLIGSIYFFTQTGIPTAAKHFKGWFLLKKCHPDFLNRFPELPSVDLLPR